MIDRDDRIVVTVEIPALGREDLVEPGIPPGDGVEGRSRDGTGLLLCALGTNPS